MKYGNVLICFEQGKFLLCSVANYPALRCWTKGFPGGSVVKTTPANAGDLSLIPGLGRPSRGRNRSPLQCSCLENPMDRGACRLQSMASQRIEHDSVSTAQTPAHLCVSLS